MQSPEGPASPSSAHDSPVRHGATIRSPVRRPARNVLFPSPQNVSIVKLVHMHACVVQTGKTTLALQVSVGSKEVCSLLQDGTVFTALHHL